MIPNEFLNMEWTKNRQREILREVADHRRLQPLFDTPKAPSRKNDNKNENR